MRRAPSERNSTARSDRSFKSEKAALRFAARAERRALPPGSRFSDGWMRPGCPPLTPALSPLRGDGEALVSAGDKSALGSTGNSPVLRGKMARGMRRGHGFVRTAHSRVTAPVSRAAVISELLRAEELQIRSFVGSFRERLRLVIGLQTNRLG